MTIWNMGVRDNVLSPAKKLNVFVKKSKFFTTTRVQIIAINQQ